MIQSENAFEMGLRILKFTFFTVHSSVTIKAA